MAEFPRNSWSLASLNRSQAARLDNQIDTTWSARGGSGRRRITRIDENVKIVEELASSQENAQRTQRTVRHSSVSSLERSHTH